MSPAARLLRWYDTYGRDLPWRRTRDPYRILVSEIMLQQTQVSRVLDFYSRWFKQFPTWKSLAEASNADAVRAWAGLGYNRRALALRDIARRIVRDGVPTDEAGWLEMKGVGPYTAAAIAAFALRQRTLPVDTNIRRVAGRLLFGIPYPAQIRDDRITNARDRLLPKRGRFYDVPQALFDLANANCTKIPTCATCPMRTVCPAAQKFLSGRVRVPKAMIKKAVERRHRDKPYPDRIYRGRILALVRDHPNGVRVTAVGPHVDAAFDARHDGEWMADMINRMARDQFIRLRNNKLFLTF